jgi:hypothetical protein
MANDFQSRYDALHREMMLQYERTAAIENHWLIYLLLAWEHLAACILSHLFVETYDVQLRWPYVVIWLAQILVAVASVKFVAGRPRIEESPLEPMNKRIWLLFVFLCINVAVLNVILGLRIFVMLPALAVLSSMAFTAMTTLMSKKFTLAGLWMFATGIAMANFPEYGFLIYGGSWWLVLHVLAAIFYRKRGRYANA